MDRVSKMMTQAVIAAEKAYAPYSKFRVGCVIETHAGNLYTGCNVENISYGLACCAERTAIFKAVSEEGPGMKLKNLYVAMADGKEGAPCGACRQVIAEFNQATTVYFTYDNEVRQTTVPELLSYAFSKL